MRRPLRRKRWLIVGASGLALAWPLAALAALPEPHARFQIHEHGVPGASWHVELRVGDSRRRLRSTVLYDQRCGETISARKLTLAGDGTLDASGAFDSSKVQGASGSWSVKARFPTRHQVEGSFRIARPGCDTGARVFKGRQARSRPGAGHHHGHVGYADTAAASPAARKEARRMLRRVRRAARRYFPSYRAARRDGFYTRHRLRKLPGVSHARHVGHHHDDRILDPRRPESLVYWRPRRGRRVLLAFMFRAPAGPRPSFAGRIPVWHRHVRAGRLGREQMMHVWLTRSIRSAYANCMPVPELEAAIPRFHFAEPARPRKEPDSSPCPQPPEDDGVTVRIEDDAFVPDEMTVDRGEKVVWRWTGTHPHNVTVQGGPARFASATKTSGRFGRRLDQPGTYQIVCTIHAPDQRMTIRVR